MVWRVGAAIGGLALRRPRVPGFLRLSGIADRRVEHIERLFLRGERDYADAGRLRGWYGNDDGGENSRMRCRRPDGSGGESGGYQLSLSRARVRSTAFADWDGRSADVLNNGSPVGNGDVVSRTSAGRTVAAGAGREHCGKMP